MADGDDALRTLRRLRGRRGRPPLVAGGGQALRAPAAAGPSPAIGLDPDIPARPFLAGRRMPPPAGRPRPSPGTSPADPDLARVLAAWADDLREAWGERAAVMEFDGGLGRADAERKAFEALDDTGRG